MTRDGHYSCWHAYVTFGIKVKGQGQSFFFVENRLFYVKMPEKTIYANIITARAAVFDLHGIKSRGQKKFWLEMDCFICKIAREKDLR